MADIDAVVERLRNKKGNGKPLSAIPPDLNEEPDWLYVDDNAPSFSIFEWGISRYLGEAGPIDWLIEGVLPRGTAGLLASLGGVGKSYLLLDLAIRLAMGPGLTDQYALGGKITKRGKVVMITAEDSMKALHRRVDQILQESEKEKLYDAPGLEEYLYLVPLPDAGGHVAFVARGEHQKYEMTQAWQQLIEEVSKIEGGVDLIILDPLQTLVQADINADPAAAQLWWSAVSRLCALTGASVIVAHHMRKEMGEIDGPASARQSIRGTTALVDGARWAYALYPATNSDRLAVEEVLGQTFPYLGLIQGAVVKSNEFQSNEVQTYIRDEATGLLVDCTSQVEVELSSKRRLSQEQINDVMAEVQARWDIGNPFSKAAQSERYLGSWIAKSTGIHREAAKNYIKEWLLTNLIEQTWHPGIKAKGLKPTS